MVDYFLRLDGGEVCPLIFLLLLVWGLVGKLVEKHPAQLLAGPRMGVAALVIGLLALVLRDPPTDAWQLAIGYAYGVDALRHGDRGAHSVGFLLQFDLERAKVNLFDPGENPLRSRGMERFFGLFH